MVYSSMHKLMTPDEVAELLRLHPRTIKRKANDGVIPSLRLPNGQVRFVREKIYKLIGLENDP
jgi:excisionase family DNA binding protein